MSATGKRGQLPLCFQRGRKAAILHAREQDRGKLWALLYMHGSAPDLEATFKDADDREAARNFMDLLAVSEGEGKGG